MIQLKPNIVSDHSCVCGGKYGYTGILWQGLHICERLVCQNCNMVRLNSLPANQSEIEQYSYYPDSDLLTDLEGNQIKDNWYTSKLRSISKPDVSEVVVKIEKFKECKDVLILNTLDYVYGHSLLYLLNLQRIIEKEKDKGIIVLVQPMLKWLIPVNDVAEIWTVELSFQRLSRFYPVLSEKLNSEIERFSNVWLSSGHIIPTNVNIRIEKFTGLAPYSFENEPEKPRVTFIWREDPDRLWVRNIYLLKGFKKLGIGRALLPLQKIRTYIIFKLLRKKLGDRYRFTVAGLGNKGGIASYVDDNRVKRFDENIERMLCQIYSESVIVFGVHGSAMLLPSAHAGMTVSLMPSKRWGNYAEDILISEADPRYVLFQKRIMPLNISIFDLRDVLIDMVTGREEFVRKFNHKEDL
jgi:hypothetical protein